jgi:hypothetical protein
VQHFFLLRVLLREWAKGGNGGEVDPIVSAFEGPLLTVGMELELVGGQALSALCAAGMTKIQVSFVVDMDYMLLCQPAEKEKAGVHVVRLVTSLRHQEAFINQHHNCVLHIILRSTTKPHAACRRLKITSTSTSPRDRPLWNLTLLFPTREQCTAAHTHLETSRVRSAFSRGLRVKTTCIHLPLSHTPPCPCPPPPHRLGYDRGPLLHYFSTCRRMWTPKMARVQVLLEPFPCRQSRSHQRPSPHDPLPVLLLVIN